jgi:hypothetical protein
MANPGFFDPLIGTIVMTPQIRSSYWLPLLTLFGMSWGSAASAATLSFSGNLDIITTNESSGRYSDTVIGQVFSGSFVYGSEAQATTDPMSPGDYDFASPPFGGAISDGMTPTTGSSGQSVQVSVFDNAIIGEDEVALFNSLLGTSFVPGAAVDNADIDTQADLSGGGRIVFGVNFVASSATAWSGADFENFPPESSNVEHAFFFITEIDSDGGTVCEGFGKIDSFATVPVPAAV